MLGHFTERATSRGRSRSFSGHGSSTVSRNESEQRRALLLPQEFKELGSERLVVIFENCKPILGEKIRYYRDKAFMSRLLKAATVSRMDMDLHLARVQQRWRYADDELPAGQTLNLEALAHDTRLLPDSFEGPPGRVADELLAFFDQGAPGIPGIGGSIEPVADEDGVLLAESDAAVMALDVAALDADTEPATGSEPILARKERTNEGSPFGESLERWVRNDPALHTDCLKAALRIETYGPWVLNNWDIYALLRRQYKAAEMVVIPGGTHGLLTPSERMVSLQGNVDWHRFWLQGEQRTQTILWGETEATLKAQYARWQLMAGLKRADDARPDCVGKGGGR